MKKVYKIAIILIMLVLTYTTVVNALSFTATMQTDHTTIAESTEFLVTVKVSNLDVGPNGINTLSGYFKYDKNIFETINESSIEGINGWGATYASDTGKLTLTKQTFVKTEESVFNVTLKTKTGVSGKEGLIQFINIMASNSEGDISATDISTTIVVGTTGGNTANTSNPPASSNAIPIQPTNRTNNTSNIGNTSHNTSNVANNTSRPIDSYVNGTTNAIDDDIPYTGVEDHLVFLIVGIVLLAIIFYIKIERLNKEMK